MYTVYTWESEQGKKFAKRFRHLSRASFGMSRIASRAARLPQSHFAEFWVDFNSRARLRSFFSLPSIEASPMCSS
jgi:hypothetical protein